MSAKKGTKSTMANNSNSEPNRPPSNIRTTNGQHPFGYFPPFLPMQQPIFAPPNAHYAWQMQNAIENIASPPPNQKACLHCQQEPTFACTRCGGNYCSQDCQRKDWQRHRFACFVMPPLVKLKSSARTVPPITPLPQNESLIAVTGFRRPNICYVRSLEPEDNDSFLKAESLINNYGKTAPPLTDLPQSNTFALAYYETQYHRVQVLAANSTNNIRALFIDKGYVKILNLTDLRQISESIINILQHAVAVKLKGVENYLTNKNVENFLNGFCDRKFMLKYDGNDADKEFYLQSLNSNESLNTSISFFANEQLGMEVYKEDPSISLKPDKCTPVKKGATPKAEPKKKHNEDATEQTTLKPMLKAPFKVMQFDKTDENFTVVILCNAAIELGLFSCVLRSNQKFLDRIRKYLDNYKDNNTAYVPQLNEYCLGNIEGKWNRVKVLHIFNKICTIINIDTTDEYKLKCDKIRSYPLDFNVPCATVLCKIEGLQPKNCNKMITTFLQQRFTVGSIQRINKIKRIDDQSVAHVVMDDLLDDLTFDFHLKVM